MEKLRFEFVMKAAADKKSNALMVTSITTPDGEIFDIPAELQEVSLHTELMKTDIYKKIKNTNLKRNQKRNVWILLNAELKAAPRILTTKSSPTRETSERAEERGYTTSPNYGTGCACCIVCCEIELMGMNLAIIISEDEIRTAVERGIIARPIDKNPIANPRKKFQARLPRARTLTAISFDLIKVRC
ncbi:unnamed protein product [Trichogramma brassicae]|uniref:Uncharacterized protein n=1 Tax=Trichogramma brassicae TaxID=86971 RepID=A0A6H5I2Q3_9HYME|nr:unnamed protein product [Trichogramma brassicae]